MTFAAPIRGACLHTGLPAPYPIQRQHLCKATPEWVLRDPFVKSYSRVKEFSITLEVAFMELKCSLYNVRTPLVVQMIKNLPATWETRVWSLGREDPWRRGWQPTPVFLAWEIPWREAPGCVQSMWSKSQTGLRLTRNKTFRDAVWETDLFPLQHYGNLWYLSTMLQVGRVEYDTHCRCRWHPRVIEFIIDHPGYENQGCILEFIYMGI